MHYTQRMNPIVWYLPYFQSVYHSRMIEKCSNANACMVRIVHTTVSFGVSFGFSITVRWLTSMRNHICSALPTCSPSLKGGTYAICKRWYIVQRDTFLLVFEAKVLTNVIYSWKHFIAQVHCTSNLNLQTWNLIGIWSIF